MGYKLPITQIDIADITGLSAVHVNRAIQNLRRQKLISFSRGKVEIRDWPAMQKVAGFNPAYLHLPSET